jgi:redox-sensitive bicupin YhaK (pirin superfamily)
MSASGQGQTIESEHPSAEIELVIRARPRDLGGFHVRRLLPTAARRLIGPFVFFDHMGPTTFPAGQGLDVRPHPHIALATVTYLFAGEILHRDSLGSDQVIVPGDVNWMVAGRGIVHSERTAADYRKQAHALHGLQAWVALPLEHEESEPAFHHHPRASLPVWERPGVELSLIAGSGYGLQARVPVSSPTLYAAVQLEAAAVLPLPAEHAERAFYVVSGAVECAGDCFGESDLVVLKTGAALELRAREASRVMLLGGAPLQGERHIYWNFVASTPERIERAKQDWRAGRFPRVPGDEVEFIPLPEEQPPA